MKADYYTSPDHPVMTGAYVVTGTKSFRLASRQWMKPMGTNATGFGRNCQNVSDEERRQVVAAPGKVLVQCDLEGAEAVAVALLCEEGPFRDLIRLKIKPHNFMCVKLFPDKFEQHISKEDIAVLTPASFHSHPNYKKIVSLCKKLTKEYALAKRTVHGANYSMGWKTFMENVLKESLGQVLLSPAEAKRLLDTYFELFPEVKRYQLRIEAAVRAGLPIANLFNHAVNFTARFTTDLARLAISWGPQSTVGQCSNIAACRFQQTVYTRGLPYDLLNITHDSCLVTGPEENAADLADLLARSMSFTFTSPIDGWSCSIGVEKQLGRNWGKYSDENPDGLKVL